MSGQYDAAIIMECGDLARTGVTGLDRFHVINIDHHPGNSAYGQLNWFDPSAAACGEMVFDLIEALGAPLHVDVATHIYLAILTDTGSFHYSSISPRTFDICRRTLEAGVDPVRVARNVYDSNNMGRLRLFGSVLSAMRLDPTGRIAIVYLDHEMAHEAGGTYEDTEGLINLPLTVKEIEAVVFFKQTEGDEYRVSMRSKGEIDIGAIAKQFGGGGHKNAAGCTVSGPIESLQKTFVERIDQAIQTSDLRVTAAAAHRVLVGASMDGLLIVDKPVGPTSHDVVARVRRALGERRIGHTGTLDPLASGVLPLVLGRATRLARFLSASEKSYEAVVRLGLATDSYDAAGQPLGAPHDGPMPDPAVDRARAGDVSRDVSPAAAGVLGEEDWGHPEPRAGAAAARPAWPERVGPLQASHPRHL